MNLRAFSLLCVLVPLLATSVCAQKIDKITHLQLEYWRAFHGDIKQEVVVDSSGKIELRTTVYSQGNDYEAKPFVKVLTAQDLVSVLALFNDVEARQYFTKTEPVIQFDGSDLSITVSQNSFSMIFTSRTAFEKNVPAPAAALGREAVVLFKLAGIAIPKDGLY